MKWDDDHDHDMATTTIIKLMTMSVHSPTSPFVSSICRKLLQFHSSCSLSVLIVLYFLLSCFFLCKKRMLMAMASLLVVSY